MEREILITAMKDSISEVLEKMFFLTFNFAGTVNEGALWNAHKGEILVSRLNFSGPFSGYFALFIPEGLAMSLAANFMGIDEESISRDHVHDTVKEIINMIAGTTFSLIDDQALFHLDIPAMAAFDHVHEKSHAGEEIFIAIKTLDHPLALKMVTSRSAGDSRSKC